MPESFDLDAEHYSCNSSSQFSQAQSLIRDIHFEPTDSVLDIGCGHGKIIAEISKNLPQGKAVGVDPSLNMIHLAKELFPSSKYKNLEFIVSTAEEIEFPSECFDFVICTNALMWVREPRKALWLMCKTLKKNGRLVVFTYDKNTPYVRLFEDVLHSSFSQHSASSAVNTMLTNKDHRLVLEEIGMKIDLFEVEDILFEYEDDDDFRNYIQGWLSCYANIPDIEQEKFIGLVLNLAKKFKLSKGSRKYSIPHTTISIVATKV